MGSNQLAPLLLTRSEGQEVLNLDKAFSCVFCFFPF